MGWDGCLLISRDGIIKYTNTGIQDLFGYVQTELVDEHFDILLPGYVREHHKKYIEDFDHKFTYIMGKNRYVHGVCKDKTTKPLEIRLGFNS